MSRIKLTKKQIETITPHFELANFANENNETGIVFGQFFADGTCELEFIEQKRALKIQEAMKTE